MKPLTDRDLEVLYDLARMRFEAREQWQRNRAEDGLAPIDFGGRNGSHHGKTASKLVDHGFVEHRRRGMAEWCQENRPFGRGGNRGSKVYRATEAGHAAAQAWHKLWRNKSNKYRFMHGNMVPNPTHLALTDAEKAELRLACHLDMPS